MMKKLFAILALSIMVCSADAQVVYKEIMKNAMTAITNPKSDGVIKRINTFKVDELKYMAMKMREVMPDSSVTILENQAMAMNDFIDLYLHKLVEYKTKSTKKPSVMINIFIKASLSNSLFNDMDKDVVESYYQDANNITRFSLDTNWPLALEEVKSALSE